MCENALVRCTVILLTDNNLISGASNFLSFLYIEQVGQMIRNLWNLLLVESTIMYKYILVLNIRAFFPFYASLYL